MTHRDSGLAGGAGQDVGGWFRSAVDDAPVPRIRSWEPLGGHGQVSPDADVVAAAELLRGRPTMILTGAGASTASGLPDYRGPDATPRQPMTYQEFVSSDLARRRYWARSTVGWVAFGEAQPNTVHHQVARLAELVPVAGLVTQNVDGLHQKAGSENVIELHGSLDRAICLTCGLEAQRDEMQSWLLDLNPDVRSRLGQLARETVSAPDGDAEVDRTETFEYPDCPRCGGILKPDVVFFGENARPEVVAAAFGVLDNAEVLVVLGSSLTVMSGLRFVRRAARAGKTIIIVNDGNTRGDELATIRLHGRVENVLERWIQVLTQ